MKSNSVALRLILLAACLAPNLYADPGPFDGTAFRGRIAFSSDGNFNDEDDWGAFPVAAAMLDAFGVTSKLVHVDYNNILAENNVPWRAPSGGGDWRSHTLRDIKIATGDEIAVAVRGGGGENGTPGRRRRALLRNAPGRTPPPRPDGHGL